MSPTLRSGLLRILAHVIGNYKPINMQIKELSLPYRIKAQARDGEAGVVIFRTPDEPYFEGCEPFQWACEKIEVWGDVSGETTVDEVRDQVTKATPNRN